MIIDDWYVDHENLVALGHYLATDKGFGGEEVAYFFEKPWKFEAEWQEYKESLSHS